MLPETRGCPQGPLLLYTLPRAASPILHPQDHARAPTCRLLLLDSRPSTNATGAFREPPTLCPACGSVVDRELKLFDRHAPIRDRSRSSTRLRAPRWDVPVSSEVSRTLSETPPPLYPPSAPVEDHFWRWHHPGRCPEGDHRPPRPPDHFIASAAWRPKSPPCNWVAEQTTTTPLIDPIC